MRYILFISSEPCCSCLAAAGSHNNVRSGPEHAGPSLNNSSGSSGGCNRQLVSSSGGGGGSGGHHNALSRLRSVTGGPLAPGCKQDPAAGTAAAAAAGALPGSLLNTPEPSKPLRPLAERRIRDEEDLQAGHHPSIIHTTEAQFVSAAGSTEISTLKCRALQQQQQQQLQGSAGSSSGLPAGFHPLQYGCPRFSRERRIWQLWRWLQ